MREETREGVAEELCNAWGSFDTQAYAEEVLAGSCWDAVSLTVRTPEQLRALRLLPGTRSVHLVGDHTDLGPLHALRDLDALYLIANEQLKDLSALTSMTAISRLGLFGLSHETPLEALRDMPELKHLTLASPVLMESVGELPVGAQLTMLYLFPQTRYLTLDGIERWPHLTALELSSATQVHEISRHRSLDSLSKLNLRNLDQLDLGRIMHLTDLRSLRLLQCDIPQGLGALRELPALKFLTLEACTQGGGPLDASPLADLKDVTVTVEGAGTPDRLT